MCSKLNSKEIAQILSKTFGKHFDVFKDIRTF